MDARSEEDGSREAAAAAPVFKKLLREYVVFTALLFPRLDAGRKCGVVRIYNKQ
jgi:hypothetical protein